MVRLLAVLMALSFPVLSFAADAIEGTTWEVKVTATDGGKDFTDVLKIKGGQFTDAELAKKGFKPANVDDNTMRMGPATFEVKAESDSNGSAKWNATVTANQMTGTLAWTKADGSTLNYTFSGERKSRN